ncbi:hypothetical protein QA596_03080 [Balneolales bacterium ANBcel1]|nr:hypothetical protein [Balneolales bacterium ANBcel1]
MVKLFVFVIITGMLPVIAAPGLQAEERKMPPGDYPTHPALEVAYTEAVAFISVHPEQRILEGEVTYRFRPKHAHVTELAWFAPGLTLSDVSASMEDFGYETVGDTLFLRFGDPLSPDKVATVSLSYETSPLFGVHFLPSGTMFSSNLPGGTGHWLPGPVHPRVTVPLELTIEVPDGYQAVSGGVLESSESNGDAQRFFWVHESPVPLSEVSFAVGDFDVEEAFYGTKNLRVYHEAGAITADERRGLLDQMVRQLRSLERQFRSEVPVSAIQIVILPDDRWETRSYAAGTAFLYKSLEGMDAQLDRALAAQWFGIALRSSARHQYTFITLLQALAAEEAGHAEWNNGRNSLEQAFEIPETVYGYEDMDRWQWARRYVQSAPGTGGMQEILVSTLAASLRDHAGERGVRDNSWFSGRLYEQTGLWIEAPEIGHPEPEPAFQFSVVVEEVRGSDSYRLNIEPLGEIKDRMFPVTVAWNRDGRIIENEYAFHGQGDQLTVEPGGLVSNITVSDASELELSFTVEKPFSFWMHQLRRSVRPQHRIKAAEALKDFADDPDLQLAVQDVIGREQDPHVQAAMYDLLAEITAGASGTERRFLDGLSSSNPEIREVSMNALKRYPGVRRVEDEVMSIIQVSDDIAFVNMAIGTYRHLVDEEEFRDFAIRFLREDRQELLFTKTLLRELFELPITEESVDAASLYLLEDYPFDLRWKAYRLLRQSEFNSNWQSAFLEKCADDADPRIRFLTLFSLSALEAEKRGPFLESRLLKEYDLRILKRVQEHKLSE